MSLFDYRGTYKPSEYPKADEIRELLSDTFWRHKELTFKTDKRDFDTLSPLKKQAITRCLCAISTVEIAVKDYWVQLGEIFPKTEFSLLGVTVAESEVRHADTYSRLLTELGMEDMYEDAKNTDVIQGRFTYLKKYLGITPKTTDKRKQLIKLILFSILIENTSLFGQFPVPMYLFSKEGGKLPDTRQIIKWTGLDESLHAGIGIYITNVMREEYPELFDEELEDIIKKACIKSLKFERDILDWVFEAGEFEELSVNNMHDYMKHRVNKAMERMGFSNVFEETLDISALDYFEDEVFAESMDDFFAVRPVDYTKGDISFGEDELF